jgi:hypothetical protein
LRPSQWLAAIDAAHTFKRPVATVMENLEDRRPRDERLRCQDQRLLKRCAPNVSGGHEPASLNRHAGDGDGTMLNVVGSYFCANVSGAETPMLPPRAQQILRANEYRRA